MQEIGEYEYPEKISFKEVLNLTEDTLTKYGGMISNFDAAKKLGHSVTNPKAISGWIFKRFEDACAFGLLKKERGGLRSTDLAVEALDPFNREKASAGKAKAIRNIKLIADAFDAWNGEIPDATAFPAKIAQITNISWQETQKHAETLRKLFIEVFPYLKTITVLEPAQGVGQGIGQGSSVGGGDMGMESEGGNLTITAREIGFGFTKTLPFTKKGVEALKKLIDFLEKKRRRYKFPFSEK
jgi:hypothetical protein